MRGPAIGNSFRARLGFDLLLGQPGGPGIVAGVQSIVRTCDEDLRPLEDAGRQETSYHANEDFLSKRRVHWPLLGAEAVPLDASESL